MYLISKSLIKSYYELKEMLHFVLNLEFTLNNYPPRIKRKTLSLLLTYFTSYSVCLAVYETYNISRY